MIQNIPSRLAKVLIVSSVLIGALFVLYVIAMEWHGLAGMHYIAYDYAFFYYAFQAVLDHHTSWSYLYNLSRQEHYLHIHNFPIDPNNQYVYPPQFAWLFSPFGLLPFSVSAILWMLMSVALYFLGILVLVKLLWRRMRRIYLIIILIVSSIMTPFQVDIGVGNVNSVLFALISLSFYFLYAHRNPKLASIPLGVAILLKVTPVAVLIVFVLRKEWRMCWWTLGVVCAGTVLSIPFVGLTTILDYGLHFFSLGHASMNNGPAPYNQSIIGVIGMFHRIGLPYTNSVVQTIAYLLVAGGTLSLMYTSIHQSMRGDWRLDMAIASLSPLIFSPLIEEAHMLLIVPTVLVLLNVAHTSRSNRRLAMSLYPVIAATILLPSLPATFALNFITAHWPQWSFIHIQMFITLEVSVITVLRLYRHADQVRPMRW